MYCISYRLATAFSRLYRIVFSVGKLNDRGGGGGFSGGSLVEPFESMRMDHRSPQKEIPTLSQFSKSSPLKKKKNDLKQKTACERSSTKKDDFFLISGYIHYSSPRIREIMKRTFGLVMALATRSGELAGARLFCLVVVVVETCLLPFQKGPLQ